MTTASCLLLVVAGMMAAVNWLAVARESKPLEYVSKPAATLAFLAVTMTLDVAHGAPWGWRVAAYVFCILGDVFLMLPKDAFVPGLGSFAVAQVLFTVSFVSGGFSSGRVLVGLAVLAPCAVLLARRFVGAIRASGHRELIVPVSVYVVVISAMSVTAVGSGSVIASAGAIIFMASDSLIAESRFVTARKWHPVGIMATYHLALACLALGLLS